MGLGSLLTRTRPALVLHTFGSASKKMRVVIDVGRAEIPFVRTLKIPEKIQHEEWASCEIITISILGEHKEARVASRIRHNTGPIGNRGKKVDEESNHCKNNFVIFFLALNSQLSITYCSPP